MGYYYIILYTVYSIQPGQYIKKKEEWFLPLPTDHQIRSDTYFTIIINIIFQISQSIPIDFIVFLVVIIHLFQRHSGFIFSSIQLIINYRLTFIHTHIINGPILSQLAFSFLTPWCNRISCRSRGQLQPAYPFQPDALRQNQPASG